MLPSLACSYSIMMDGCSGTRVLISFWQLDSCCTETLHVRQCPSLPSRQTLTRTGIMFFKFPPGQVLAVEVPGAGERHYMCRGWVMINVHGGTTGSVWTTGSVVCSVGVMLTHGLYHNLLGQLCNYHSVGSSHSGSVNDWILWGKIES